ncbi:MAG: class I SAM-dependent methyltransferase [Firmicutes bacterium]|nr:class I SAM-dependent methyltransferase [Bacillota bacterium]
MKINTRVDKVLNYIQKGSTVADIGCDHGYVLIKGVTDDIIKSGIGVEVAKGPFNQAKINVHEYNMDDYINIRYGNGLDPVLINECDVCVIGGMGGRLITNILRDNKEKASNFKRLILQPMNSEFILRKYLLENNWVIVDEDILIEDRLYLYIIAEKGNMEVHDDFIYEIGPVLAKKNNSGRNKYIKQKIFKLEKILMNLKEVEVKETNKIKIIKQAIEKWRSYIGD